MHTLTPCCIQRKLQQTCKLDEDLITGSRIGCMQMQRSKPQDLQQVCEPLSCNLPL